MLTLIFTFFSLLVPLEKNFSLEIGSTYPSIEAASKALEEEKCYFDGIFGTYDLNKITVTATYLKVRKSKRRVVYSKFILPEVRVMLDSLLPVIIGKESGGNTRAVGDTHLSTPSIGIVQIRIPCLRDVNKLYGTNYVPDDRYSKEKSFEIYYYYLSHGIRLFKQKYGKSPTPTQVKAMWNGGIYGGYKNKQALRYANST